MISLADRKERMDAPKNEAHRRPHASLATAARDSIQRDCDYAFCFRFLRYSSRDGVLTVRGCLPSFYLKQVLLAQLKRVEGLDRIDDQVDVISSTGLSSVPKDAA